MVRRGRGGLAAVVALLLTGVVTTTGSPSGAAVRPPGSRSTSFQVGVTHTEHSADAYGNPRAVARARSLLATVGPLQAQHIMGFGALNPEPRKGHYRFASLDARIELIRDTGGSPVITLCCSPDWMKGGRPGQTDWNRLSVAPKPSHYDDFARLAVTIAQRYPDVRRFQVWNELKGFFDTAKNRWDYEGYTRLYNDVYDALKAYDPSLQVGGPYVPVDSYAHPARNGAEPSRVRGRWGVVDQRSLDVLTYWLSHAHGADFVAVDGSIQTTDGVSPPWRSGVRKFAAVDRWLRARTELPIWWSEFYVGLRPGSDRSTPRAVDAALRSMQRSGAAVAMLWGPQCDTDHFPCLWSDTTRRDGGRPTDFYPVIRRYSQVADPAG